MHTIRNLALNMIPFLAVVMQKGGCIPAQVAMPDLTLLDVLDHASLFCQRKLVQTQHVSCSHSGVASPDICFSS